MVAMQSTDLVPRQTLAQFVEAHDQSAALAREGLEKLAQAQEILSTWARDIASVIGSRFDSYNLQDPSRRSLILAETETRIQEEFWQRVLTVSGIRDMMGPEDRERMDKMFREHATPAFTLDNILSTLRGLAESQPDIFASAVRSCFDRLRPRHHSEGHKTNKRDRVGRKVIVWHAVSGHGWNYYARVSDFVKDLDKVFHMLAGKGFPQHPDDAATVIASSMQARSTQAETEYFRFKWFKIGTLHIEFKRADLLQEFNRIAAGGRPEMGGKR